jgi:hypothetical protein
LVAVDAEFVSLGAVCRKFGSFDVASVVVANGCAVFIGGN